MSYSEYVRDRNESLSEAQKEDLEYFCEWLDRVESIVEEEIGYDLRDLPDQPYRDLFDDKYSPEIVAESVIDEWRMEVNYYED
jgi:hypothetical protein